MWGAVILGASAAVASARAEGPATGLFEGRNIGTRAPLPGAPALLPAPRPRDMVTVTQHGADPTGVQDSTRAFRDAAAQSDWVTIPCGAYRINWVLDRSNFRLSGSGCVTLKPAAPGDILTIRDANFTTVEGVVLAGGGWTTGDGVVIEGRSGNIHLKDIRGDGLPGAAVNCKGSADAPQSGNRISGHSYILHSGAGVRWAYCHDSHISGVQIGQNRGPGLLLINSGASQFVDNFIWENQIGVKVEGGRHNWFSGNRVTQSQLQGVICERCVRSEWRGNQFYTNSLAAVGGAEDAQFTAATDLVISDNQFFDWSGRKNTSYGLTVDAASQGVTHTGNRYARLNTVAPAAIAAKELISANNAPAATPGVNWQMIGSLPFATPPTGIGGGAASTLYLAQISATTEQGSPVPTAGLIGCMSILSSATPAKGEIWTYTLRRNNADTSFVLTQGAGHWAARGCVASTPATMAENDTVSVKLATNGPTDLARVAFRGVISLFQ